MNAYLRDKLLQKLDTLSDERGYQVLDYVEFLESKYAERPAPGTAAAGNPLTRFADAVEEKLRAGKVSATTIAETMSLMNKAVGVLNGAAAAGKSVASDLMSATNRVVDAATSAAASATSSDALRANGHRRVARADERHDWCEWRVGARLSRRRLANVRQRVGRRLQPHVREQTRESHHSRRRPPEAERRERICRAQPCENRIRGGAHRPRAAHRRQAHRDLLHEAAAGLSAAARRSAHGQPRGHGGQVARRRRDGVHRHAGRPDPRLHSVHRGSGRCVHPRAGAAAAGVERGSAACWPRTGRGRWRISPT